MSEKKWCPENILEVLGDSLCRDLLLVANGSPASAHSLAERVSTSLPTVYHRLNVLVDYDLVVERRRVNESGDHYRLFETVLERAELALENDEYAVSIETGESQTSFESFWNEFRGASTDATGDRSAESANAESTDSSPS